MNSILVTGAAGFIGSSFPKIAEAAYSKIIVLDKLTYAGNLANLYVSKTHELPKNIHFVRGDIGDRDLVDQILRDHKPQAIVNFAAESHVDNSISSPGAFIQTNVVGVFNLLQTALEYWKTLEAPAKTAFRFIQVSTDEVFGALDLNSPKFSETTTYAPNSPYSASKASADHLARAWFHTYGLPTIVTNCSNNYGPRQFPEKLIPLMILNALAGKPLPVYGQGQNIRDWIHVEDHCQGVFLALTKGRPGESYCFGGNSERKNIDVVHAICDLLTELRPLAAGAANYKALIKNVTDRAGHDFRYAIDDSKAQTELGFKRKHSSFEQGLKATIEWYLNNSAWIKAISGTAK